jgi:hypothetical protein
MLKQTSEIKDNPNSGILPWLAPVLVLCVWIFIQVTFNFSALVGFVNQIGILNGLTVWVSNDPQQMNWFIAAQSTLGGVLSPQGQTGLQVLNSAGLFAQDLVVSLLWQIGAALLYCGALFLVWNKAEGIYLFLAK